MQKHWNTYYIYHTGNADDLLKDIVHLSVLDINKKVGKGVKFFFIRYFENGYHIRLRLLLNTEESTMFFPVLKKHISVYEHLNQVHLKLKQAEYIPETERYGNSNTITHAEDQFWASSRFVLHHLVQNDPLTVSERYLLALKTHFAFFKGMGLSRNDSQQLCDKFVQSWLPVPFSDDPDEQKQNRKTVLSAFQQQFESYQTLLQDSIEEFWNSLNTTTDPFLQQFLEMNEKVWKNYTEAQLSSEALDEALLSFIHMTNNRLGIVNAEESYLLFLILQTIPLIKDYDQQPRT
ncbi:thiopeptide-type bacteriocin biosynthesis protein [Chryseobacterium herbae]|uniref:Thiopeptide-type bacteriocin biosynthesis protein n=1 Tax=Chryseobacterium herbae TaxID=2976476 RepID=A0ABT2IYV3_9FLAO|nr:thiopeptide-type bacteriocin biosynthesis protein [Chryseobacterium sp. pc1-10]MCT2564033.1 thiopeptide-type bacteriocin biosynthesis protein [Chryseobacterium sp. pc1-10]